MPRLRDRGIFCGRLSGRLCFCVDRVHIRCCGGGGLGFRPYGGSLLTCTQRLKNNQKRLLLRTARSLGLGVPSLRDRSGRSAYGSPLTPALSPRRGSRFVRLSESKFDSVSQVGIALPNTSISSLSLREKARVRGLLILLWLLIFLPHRQAERRCSSGG